MLLHGRLKKTSGFTLIELVAVIVLLGIVTVAIAPRFSGNSSLSQYALRDQLISSYRYAQQHAMYDHSGNCYRLLVDANGFGPQRDDGATIEYIGPVGQITFTGDYSDITVTNQTIFFDGLGNALTGSCNGAAVSNPLTLSIAYSGTPAITVEIFPSGYVRPI